MAKKNSKKKKKENPIYSKLNYQNAHNIKVDVLEIQAHLLKTIKSMQFYQELRKKEYMLKIKLRNELKETKNLFKDLLETIPETKGIKEKRKELTKKHEEKPKDEKKSISVEAQLQDIRKRLQELA
jgi:predicted nuclease with TOPRIM domain